MLLRVILLKWDIFGPSKSQFFEVVFKEEHWFFFFSFVISFPISDPKIRLLGCRNIHAQVIGGCEDQEQGES